MITQRTVTRSWICLASFKPCGTATLYRRLLQSTALRLPVKILNRYTLRATGRSQRPKSFIKRRLTKCLRSKSWNQSRRNGLRQYCLLQKRTVPYAFASTTKNWMSQPNLTFTSCLACRNVLTHLEEQTGSPPWMLTVATGKLRPKRSTAIKLHSHPILDSADPYECFWIEECPKNVLKGDERYTGSGGVRFALVYHSYFVVFLHSPRDLVNHVKQILSFLQDAGVTLKL